MFVYCLLFHGEFLLTPGLDRKDVVCRKARNKNVYNIDIFNGNFFLFKLGSVFKMCMVVQFFRTLTPPKVVLK